MAWFHIPSVVLVACLLVSQPVTAVIGPDSTKHPSSSQHVASHGNLLHSGASHNLDKIGSHASKLMRREDQSAEGSVAVEQSVSIGAKGVAHKDGRIHKQAIKHKVRAQKTHPAAEESHVIVANPKGHQMPRSSETDMGGGSVFDRMRHAMKRWTPSKIIIYGFLGTLVFMGSLAIALTLYWKRTYVPSFEKPYPWPELPALESMLSAGLTYHSNQSNPFPDALKNRGLHESSPGIVALVSMWPSPKYPTTAEWKANFLKAGIRWLGCWTGLSRQRGLVETYPQGVCAKLGLKRGFAVHLANANAEHHAPKTFMSCEDMRKSMVVTHDRLGRPGKSELPNNVKNGLWFLKHSSKENNRGVTCFRGAEALLLHWQKKVPMLQRGHYVAQAEVRGPMLLSDWQACTGPDLERKVSVRAYCLVVSGNRHFFHRELLLKAHPQVYDPHDADPNRHVFCCMGKDGVTAMRGSMSPHYQRIWPRIRDCVKACLVGFNVDKEEESKMPGRHRAFGANFPGGVETLKFKLIGIDLIVDQSGRPWVIELNPGPGMSPDERDPVATTLKEDVMDDLAALTVDPLLRAMDKATSVLGGKVARKDPVPTGSGRGFVEL